MHRASVLAHRVQQSASRCLMSKYVDNTMLPPNTPNSQAVTIPAATDRLTRYVMDSLGPSARYRTKDGSSEKDACLGVSSVLTRQL